MGINSNGQLEIVTSIAPCIQGLSLKGALGYCNGVNIINETCEKLYSKSGVGIARSINIEDLEKHFTETGIKNRDASFTEKEYSEKYSPIIYDQEKNGILGQSENLKELITQDETKYNETLKIKTSAFQIVSSDSSKFKTLIYSTTPYWIATRCVSYNYYGAAFSLFIMNSGSTGYSELYSSNPSNSIDEKSFRLRPVVTLNADVTLESAGENTWNIK